MNLNYLKMIQLILILMFIGSCGKAKFFDSEAKQKQQYSDNKSADGVPKQMDENGNNSESGSNPSDQQDDIRGNAGADGSESQGSDQGSNDGTEGHSRNNEPGADGSNCDEGGQSGSSSNGSESSENQGSYASDQEGSDSSGQKGSGGSNDSDHDSSKNNCQGNSDCSAGNNPDDSSKTCGDNCGSQQCENKSCNNGGDHATTCNDRTCEDCSPTACPDCQTNQCPGCSPTTNPPPEKVVVTNGIEGGHFDVDTFYVEHLDGKSKKGKDDAAGFKLKKHVHEYDDKYSTNGVNFFGPSNGSDKADEVKIDELIPSNLKFKIKLVNSKFNQGGFLYIGETAYGHNNLPDESQVYTKAELKKLSIVFDLDSLKENGIQPAQPKWVKENDLGPENSYRSGALTVQIIDSSSGKVIIECSVYWHKDGLKKQSFL